MPLTRLQDKAVKDATAWFRAGVNRRRPFFTILGPAGTGKSFTLGSILDSIGLSDAEVVNVAYTGMAASVLIRKGIPATTIHKLIYNPTPGKKGKVFFKLKDELPAGVKLAVVDEISQVSQDLLDDLMTFGLPILVLGDKEQLKPVKGKMNNLLDDPDIVLDEVMRQALDNPILYLATQVRMKKKIQYGSMGDNVRIIPKNNIPLEYLQHADQIIAGYNNNVDQLNHLVRKQIYELESPMPYVGEKLMCYRNNWNEFTSESGIDMFLVNGLQVYVEELYEYNEVLDKFQAKVRPTFFDNASFTKFDLDGLYFLHGFKNDTILYEDKMFEEVMFKRRVYEDSTDRRINKFNYGYATTAYKSQGSEFDSVFYYRDAYNNVAQDYVSITRAKSELIVAM